MNKAIWLVIAIILIVCSFWLGTTYIEYRLDRDTRLIQEGLRQTAIEITRTANIPIVNNNTIQWIPISSICGGSE